LLLENELNHVRIYLSEDGEQLILE
jgi:hypothetical protein